MSGETVVPQEGELLLRMAKGDEAAFTALYRHYSGPLYLNFVRMVKDEVIAEEIIQDLFSRIWQKRESISIEKNFSAYLYRTGYNLLMDFYRKVKRDRLLYEKFRQAAIENYSHIEEVLHLKDSQALVSKALDTLPPQQRRVFELCRIEGHSYKEVAEILGISPNTVKEHFVKANQAIRKFITGNADTAIGLLFIAALYYSK
ncbi:RNA polymerase sigma factor [Pseudoflavitalea rhizosphaerae]|uniref:RNA polymerase sigma factor n=1 Tax=Pseudoflavitalea rhizosphaerae TaxID=1884793 RepID=UPI000F8EF1D2|nr:RNA polymerase sigma-70 factor [Pseudoflavitalea rhizosphaerae]